MSNGKKNIGRYFKKGTLGFKILFLSLIFVFLSVSVFSPFMSLLTGGRIAKALGMSIDDFFDLETKYQEELDVVD